MTTETLISAGTLGEELDATDLRVFDCRFSLADSEQGHRTYLEGHIPGAAYVHLDNDLSAPVTANTGRHPLPDKDILTGRLGELGIDADKRVVVYDDASGAIAARMWWLLRWLGHDRVAVLDGGFKSWVANGLGIRSGEERYPQTAFTSRPDDALWCSAGAVELELQQGHAILVDARDEARFQGKVEPLDKVAGHIPGSLNHPFIRNLGSDQCFLPRESLREAFSALIHPRQPQEVIHSCGSGVTACHNLLAMEHCGLSGSRLYVGSWSDWITDPGRPVARSPES